MRIHADPDPQPWTKPSTNVIIPERNYQNPTFHNFFSSYAVRIETCGVQGYSNIREQRSIIGEYSDIPMEEMLEWINKNVAPDGVFAGVKYSSLPS